MSWFNKRVEEPNIIDETEEVEKNISLSYSARRELAITLAIEGLSEDICQTTNIADNKLRAEAIVQLCGSLESMQHRIYNIM